MLKTLRASFRAVIATLVVLGSTGVPGWLEAPAPSSPIEWRFTSTSATLANNLTTGVIRDRGGSAVLTTNMENAPASLFADPAAGDLHLVDPFSSPVDVGTLLGSGLCDGDIDRQSRNGSPNLGADEFGSGLVLDGFEIGNALWWSVGLTDEPGSSRHVERRQASAQNS